ncbi:hypothetical protein [Candidatus Poriferisocius sp.]|uniref:hypothetical protein n=1 Tax=Candidatus Poriferisocius sp. TaxID=3101276 RepID=UPI003B02B5F4
MKWLGILLAALMLVAGCGSDAPKTPETAREHPGWNLAVNRCERALVDERDSAEWGSAQWALGSPTMGDARRDVCEQMAQCQWDETGTPAVEFTVSSRYAYEDCYYLVFSQFD